ncbi:hypothetical protein QUF64_05280 [Anaerolineales bacterium HSG6]|nr:hypothetical protein [Anaerolineales bacterium HSG6]
MIFTPSKVGKVRHLNDALGLVFVTSSSSIMEILPATQASRRRSITYSKVTSRTAAFDFARRAISEDTRGESLIRLSALDLVDITHSTHMCIMPHISHSTHVRDIKDHFSVRNSNDALRGAKNHLCGQGQVNELQTGYGELTVGELANMAGAGDLQADRAIKMIKQANKKAQKYGGK